MKFKSSIEIQAGVADSGGSLGLAGQILSSDGSNVLWTNEAPAANRVEHVVKAGVAVNKGQAVYVTNADGTNIIVGLASNLSEATSSKTIGLIGSTTAVNGFANVVATGLLSGLNTSAGVAGDPVWLGESGNLIYGLANKPYAPKHLVFIGIVTRSNANNGEIFINVQNGFELNEIHDVDLKTTVPVNEDILGFDGSLWVNKTIAGWLGYTPANSTLYLPLTGGTLTGDLTVSTRVTANELRTLSNQQLVLSAGEAWSVATGQTNEYIYLNAESGIEINSSPDNWTSGWAGRKTTRISDANGNSSFGGNVSATNGYFSVNVGIGTTSPGYKLDVAGAIKSNNDILLNTALRFGGSVNDASRIAFASNNFYHDNFLGEYHFRTTASYLTRLYINNNGNVGIGTTSPSEVLEIKSSNILGAWLKINPSVSGREAGIKIRQSTTYGADIYFNDSSTNGKGIKIDYVNVDTRYNAMFISPSTNPSIGLGTYTPAEKLDVVGNVKANNFIGNLTGTASKAIVSNHTTNNTEYFPTWLGGDGALYYSSDKYKYNPSLGRLTAATFKGALEGNADTATSTSKVYGVVPIISSSTQGTAYNTAVQIREKGLAGTQSYAMSAAPRLAFHWSGVVASSIAMEANGRIAIMDNPGTSYQSLIAGSITGYSFNGAGTGLTGTASGLSVNYATTAGSATDATNATFLNKNTQLLYGASGLNYFNQSGPAGNDPLINNTPSASWFHIIRMNHANNGGYYVDIAAGLNTSELHYRRITNGVANGWYKIIDDTNIGSQSVSYATTAGTATPNNDSNLVHITGDETIYNIKNFVDRVRIRNAIDGQGGSGAALQVNGFQRTGNIYLHTGGNTPDGVRVGDTMSNIGGNLTWTGSTSGTVYHSGNFIAGTNYQTPQTTLSGYGITDTPWTAYLPLLGKAADSSKLNGASDSEAANASTIAKRNSNGDISVRLIRSEYPDQSTMSGGLVFRVNNSSDNYNRVVSSTSAVKVWLGLGNVDNTADSTKSVSYADTAGSATDSTKLLLVGGVLSGNLSVPTLSSLSTSASLTNYYQGNNTSLVAQTPMTTIWHDLFAFGKAYTTTFDTSVDGTAWVSGTVDKRLFAQKESQNITVLDYTTTKSVRWTFNNVSWGSGQWVVIGFTYQSIYADKTVVIESSADNVTYTERHSSTFSNASDTVHLFVNSYGGDAFLRVRIIWNSGNGNIALSSIRLLSARAGNQGLGKEYAYPYTWDENQKVTFPNEVVATTFSGALSGNADTATKIQGIGTTFSGTYPMVVNVSGVLYSHTAVTFQGSTGNLTTLGNLVAQNSNGNALSAQNTSGGYINVGISSNAASTGYINYTNNLVVTGGPASFDSTVAATRLVATAAGANDIPLTDNVYCSGFGLIGNRAGAVHITNSNSGGELWFNIGGAHGNINKARITSGGTTFVDSVTAPSFINQRVVLAAGFNHTATSGAEYFIPIGYIGTTTSRNYYNGFVAPYAGRVRKIIIKNHGFGNVPSVEFGTVFKVYKNGVVISSYNQAVSGGMSLGASATITYSDSAATFNAGDILNFSYAPDGSFQQTTSSISLEYTE